MKLDLSKLVGIWACTLSVVACAQLDDTGSLSKTTPASKCARMAAMKFDEGNVVRAEVVSSGDYRSSFDQPYKIPALCHIEVISQPTPISHIVNTIWLPLENWNGKFVGFGSGGAGKHADYAAPAMAAATSEGYAAAYSDLGSDGKPGKQVMFTFGNGNPEKQTDWLYRATHLMTRVSKKTIQEYYGDSPSRSYFSGCSTGGQQALEEATRYPEDYDGIIVGSPGSNRTNIHMAMVWHYRTLFGAPSTALTKDHLALVNKAVLNECDELDGVIDGVVGNPGQCQFDPASLICEGEETESCLSPPQAQNMSLAYAGPHNPRTGERYFPGLPLGAELQAAAVNADVAAWGAELLSWSPDFAFDGDLMAFDFDKDALKVNAVLGHLNTSTDVEAFRNKGGKLLFWGGTYDVLTWDMIDYYKRATSPAEDETNAFARLFLAPGAGHCFGGPGPNKFDSIGVLDRWVENGEVPKRIIATKYEDDDPKKQIIRTRPLCAYPAQAVWTGTGDTDDAQNFECRQPL